MNKLSRRADEPPPAGPMAEKIFSTIANDAAAQGQYLDSFRRSEYLEPEKTLLLALLEDAIHRYRKFAAVRSRAGRQQFREAEEWLMGGGDGGVFAFDNVCEYLGLDPEYVRRGLRESQERALGEIKTRRHAHHRKAA
jgi:hypothetical protein